MTFYPCKSVKSVVVKLFDDALFEVFGKVGSYFGGGTFGSDFCYVVFDH